MAGPIAQPDPASSAIGIGVSVGTPGLVVSAGVVDPFCWVDPCFNSCFDPCFNSWNNCGWFNNCSWWGWGWCGRPFRSCWSWCSWPWWSSWSWCGWGWGWGWGPSWYDAWPVQTYVSTNWIVDDGPARVVRPLNNAELGDIYLRNGDAQAAIAAYRMHLDEFPSDTFAMRSLGMALLAEGRAGEASEQIDAAYRSNPGLADQPARPDMFASPDEFRVNLDLAAAYANRVKDAPSWLTVAVLLQADGNTVQAEMMLDRAVAGGLGEEVSVPLRRVLRGS